VLDPWFLYGGFGIPAMGLRGIALSTVLIHAGGCMYLAVKVRQTGVLAGAEANMAIPRPGPFREIARQGLPACVNMLTVGMGMFVITFFVSRFGKDAVAAYGTAMRVEQMVLVVTIGLSVATLTLTAQNHGAGLFPRIRETIRTTLLYGALLTLGGSLLVFLLCEPLMGLFTEERRVTEIGAVYLRIDALVFYAYVILSVCVSALQGMKRPLYAVLIGLWRQIVAPALLFWLLTEAMGIGLLGVWWGIFGITWSAALFTLFYARRSLRRAERSG
jgi:MATE family, multidrug efflux pump